MKDSGIEWIGEIPNDWRVYKVKNICRIRGEKNRPQAQVLSVYRELGVVVKAERNDNHNVTSEDTSSYKYVLPNDLVVNKMKAWQGSMGISRFEGIVSPAYYVFKIISDEIYPMYIHYLLRNVAYLPEYRRLSGGIRPGQWDLSIENLQNIPILIPPYDNQCRIVSYLDRKCSQIDAIIARQQEVIEKLKAYKLSVITEAVTKGLNPNVPMKDSGVEWIGEIPEHWETASISRVATVVRGASPRPAGDPRYFNGHDIPWITVAEVTKDDGKYITSTESFLTEEGAKYSRLVEKGTLLLSNSGATLGVPKVTLITGCINDGSVAFFDLKVEQMYLLYIFKSRTLELRKQMQGYGQPNLNTTIIKSIAIPLPHPDEQKSICEYLDKRCKAVDDTIKIKEKVVDRLAEYKKSLIYEVVTGKKEV